MNGLEGGGGVLAFLLHPIRDDDDDGGGGAGGDEERGGDEGRTQRHGDEISRQFLHTALFVVGCREWLVVVFESLVQNFPPRLDLVSLLFHFLILGSLNVLMVAFFLLLLA